MTVLASFVSPYIFVLLYLSFPLPSVCLLYLPMVFSLPPLLFLSFSFPFPLSICPCFGLLYCFHVSYFCVFPLLLSFSSFPCLISPYSVSSCPFIRLLCITFSLSHLSHCSFFNSIPCCFQRSNPLLCHSPSLLCHFLPLCLSLSFTPLSPPVFSSSPSPNGSRVAMDSQNTNLR